MTRLERSLLGYIVDYQAANYGVSPSFEEMMKAIGIRSKSGIFRMLNSLEEQNILRRDRNRARRLFVTFKPDDLAFIGVTNEQLVHEAMKRGLIVPTLA